ncbi:MAG: hypothetical protein CFE21_11805 [Bacteroidetes bacterium B1(2017)]|nr:MAG: hypothetical protein CFE21_11805 [Bacteroidetes bacterium B1(2017)]
MKTKFLLILLTFLLSITSYSQVAKNQVLQIQATANANGSIKLSWPPITYAGNYWIYKRLSQSTEDWGANPFATVAGSLFEYTDVSVSAGQAYEYRIIKVNGTTAEGFGYIYAGNKFSRNAAFTSILLLVDSSYQTPLASEISQLEADLYAESYVVKKLPVGRSEAVLVVKARILAAYNALTPKPEAIFLLGHIPVPYSGFYSANGDAPPPDGHVEGSGNHTGAWPADVYYGIIENVFTDNTVNCSTGTLARNHNIVGDGKFDQTKLPAAATLEVGRVDLSDLPAFGKSEIELTRDYLTRNHAWRTGKWKVTERGLIDNNFTTLNIASTGYANFAALVGPDKVVDDQDYFVAQRNGSYLWSYGCGAGSYVSCQGIGTTNSFVNDSFENVFTILAGSFFGDWDIQNNLLRAPLASSSLASCMGGIPKWYLHHMGLGDRIGKGTKITQNNSNFYFSGNFNMSYNSMHIALMGDPTLRMRNLQPIEGFTASFENNSTKLTWNASADADVAYDVFKIDTVAHTYTKLNTSVISGTNFTDVSNTQGLPYLYAVMPVKLEIGASGSYYNLGATTHTRIGQTSGLSDVRGAKIDLSYFPNPLNGAQELTLQLAGDLGSDLINVELYNLEGQLVTTSNFEPTSARSNILKMKNIPSQTGVYVLKVTCGNAVSFGKILVN